MKKPVVYLMASKRNGTLYIGVTSDLAERCWQHKSVCMEGFTNKYQIHLPVYYEIHRTIRAAIAREKQINIMETRMENKNEISERHLSSGAEAGPSNSPRLKPGFKTGFILSSLLLSRSGGSGDRRCY